MRKPFQVIQLKTKKASSLRNFFFRATPIIVCLLLLPVSLTTAESVRSAHTEVELVSEYSSVKQGTQFWIALQIRMDKDWHIYWRNPGDAGLPVSIEWELPEGVSVGELQWPYPHLIREPMLTNYGYDGEVYLLNQVRIAPDAALDQPRNIKAHVSWLACMEACVPGKADLSFPIEVTDGVIGENIVSHSVFKKTLQDLPQSSEKLGWKAEAALKGNHIQITLQPLERGQEVFLLSGVFFFPTTENLIDYHADQSLEKVNGNYQLTVPIKGRAPFPETIEGVLVSDNAWVILEPYRAMELNAPLKKTSAQTIPVTLKASAGVGSIGMAVLFAFVGGLILNLMPCVLPVLSIKILGLLEHFGDDRRRMFREGVIFTFGVLTSFWVLTGLLLSLRYFGAKVGWGFQFQSPTFLILMAGLFVWFALSLLGVFEIGTSLTGLESKAKKHSILNNSFSNGVLAAIVATPCTAPFMGSAMGFALVSSEVVTFLVFTTLGFGMAFPYLALCRFPNLLRFAPKPGPWMITLKKFFAFLFLATAIWLVWVLGMQTGVHVMASLLFGLLILAFGGWVLGEWGNITRSKKSRGLAKIAAVVCLGVGFWLATQNLSLKVVSHGKEEARAIEWKVFSEEAVGQALEEGKSVFIDFTAAWCLSCQVNERVVFHNSDVIEAFDKEAIVAFKADWTNYDEAVTEALASYGKASVPLYVFYEKGKSNQPILLPEIITPQTVLNFIKKEPSA